ncbi:MAG TPA: copper resistance protein NlpE N-terminal domain-containing protein [Anditalea sp.]|nr:copper resistance protein NlpE N-terminal domain-containing protein [Anditalea sp.]
MRRIIVFLLSITIFAACGTGNEGEGGEDNRTVIQELGDDISQRVATNYLVFEGEIPCIDCDRIEVELWLEKDSAQQTSEYWIKTIHRGTHTGDIEEEVEGVYTRQVGYRDDPSAIVYQLNPGTNEPRYFLLNEQEGTLSVLGPDRREMEAEDDQYDYNLQLRRN